MAAEVPVWIRLFGKEEVEKGITDIKKSFESAGKAALLAFAGFEAVQKVTAFFIDARKEAQELTRANVQLKFELGYTSEELNKQSQILSKKYMIDEKDIKQAQSHLAMNHLTEEQIKKLTPAILNYSQAMGVDLLTATNTVTKAVEGQSHTMRGVPGIIAGAAGSYEKVNSVIDLLNSRFHDQADAVLESKDGWDKMAFAVKEYTKEVGIMLFGAGKEETANRQNKNSIDELTKAKLELARIEAIQASFTDKSKTGLDKFFNTILHNKTEVADYRKELEKNIERHQKTVTAYDDAQKSAKEKGIAENKAAKEQEDRMAKAEAARLKAIEDSKKLAKEEKEAISEVEKMRRDGIRKEGEAQLAMEEQRKEITKISYERRSEEATKRLDVESKLETMHLMKDTKGRLELLKKEHDKEISLFKDGSKRKLAVEKEFAVEEAEFIKIETERKIAFDLEYADNTLALMDQLASATSANAQVMKRIKEGEAVVSAAKGALGVVENSGEFIANFGPIAGPIAMGAEIALMVALAGAQIAKIESAKMAYGGVVTGGIPGVDSVPALLMPGEIVYNPANPNPALASMINSNNQSSNTNLHVYGPTINISGGADQKTISRISQATQRAIDAGVKQAMRNMQQNGKLKGVALYN